MYNYFAITSYNSVYIFYFSVLENIFNKTERIQIVNSRVEVEFHDNMPELFQLVDTGTNKMSKCYISFLTVFLVNVVVCFVINELCN